MSGGPPKFSACVRAPHDLFQLIIIDLNNGSIVFQMLLVKVKTQKEFLTGSNCLILILLPLYGTANETIRENI